MSTLQDFVFLILYTVIFMVGVGLLFLMLSSSKTKDEIMSDTMSDKTSVSMEAYTQDQGLGRNNVKGADKDYTANQQKKNMTVINGEDVYLDVIAIIDAFTKEDISRYEAGQLSIYIKTEYIAPANMIAIKNRNPVILKNLRTATSGKSYQRVYKYDKDLNIIAINYN